MKKKIIALVIATFLGLCATTISFEQVPSLYTSTKCSHLDTKSQLFICTIYDDTWDTKQY